MCDEYDTRDYATGSRRFVAVPGSRSGEQRRQQRTAWLEPYAHFHLTAPYQDSER